MYLFNFQFLYEVHWEECESQIFVISGISVETAESRSAGSQFDPEAGASIVQMHRVHSNIRHVPSVWEPRVLRPQRGCQACHGQGQD